MLLLNRTKDFKVTDKCLFEISDSRSLISQLSRRNDWQFRIYAQCLMRSRQDYLIYFVSLTYSNHFLPRFRHLFKSLNDDGIIEYDKVDFSCFSRDHIRKFFRALTRDLRKYFGVIDVDYICCSEFGSTTARPHYHLLLMIPRFKAKYKGFLTDCDAVNSIEVHKLIVKHWSEIRANQYNKDGVPLRTLRGWVLPNNPFGGDDSKGHFHKPLLVDRKNLANAAIYVSKYCTKQLDFFKVPEFVKAYKLAKQSGDADLLHSLDLVKPFLKTSLHFGECINDLVMSPFVPWAKNVFFTENQSTFEKLYDGIWTPLYRSRPLSVPQYNKRKMLNERILVDHYRFIDYRDLSIKHKYIYASKLSPLGVKFAPYFYRRKVDEIFFKINSFFSCHFDKDSFSLWLRDFDNDNYDNIISLLSSFNHPRFYKPLAVYRVVYQDRILPSSCSDVRFCDVDSVSYFDSVEYVDPNNCYNNFIHDRFCTDTIVHEYETIKPFYVDYDRANPLYRLFPALRFDGNEDIDTMLLRAKSYFLVSSHLVHNPLVGNLTPLDFHNLLFNNMPCFRGYDDVLHVIFSYLQFVTNQKLKAVADKERKKKMNKDLIYS